MRAYISMSYIVLHCYLPDNPGFATEHMKQFAAHIQDRVTVFVVCEQCDG